MILQDPFDDGKAKSGAVSFGCEKRVEDHVKNFSRNSAAGIGKADSNVVSSRVVFLNLDFN